MSSTSPGIRIELFGCAAASEIDSGTSGPRTASPTSRTVTSATVQTTQKGQGTEMSPSGGIPTILRLTNPEVSPRFERIDTFDSHSILCWRNHHYLGCHCDISCQKEKSFQKALFFRCSGKYVDIGRTSENFKTSGNDRSLCEFATVLNPGKVKCRKHTNRC
eukprot:m.128386 g.128386  ORF g.128386 m.128386 type:complete len:162 (+) comp37953_c0_seq16:3185-3670(+)